MCRHTVGLNYTAIGIENVGNSDQEILSNPRQLQVLAYKRRLPRFGSACDLGGMAGLDSNQADPTPPNGSHQA